MKLNNLLVLLTITLIVANSVESRLKKYQKVKDVFKLNTSQRSGRPKKYYDVCEITESFTNTEKRSLTKFPCPGSESVECYPCKLKNGNASKYCFQPVSMANDMCYSNPSTLLFSSKLFDDTKVKKTQKVDLQISNPSDTYYILDNSASMEMEGSNSAAALNKSISDIEGNHKFIENYCYFDRNNRIVTGFEKKEKLVLDYSSTKFGKNDCLKALIESGVEENIKTIHIITDGTDANEVPYTAKFKGNKTLNVEILYNIASPEETMLDWLSSMNRTTPGIFSIDSDVLKFTNKDNKDKLASFMNRN